eukprot:CAMPEP_0171588520 /NCGR_PEP_ID=MMETSP0961-20121227/14173_1 /TAXON_ID=87120 /ORGANISM="Aurantiochytrium limacinum, Strain ATCCMYA-1381" /LENGTH=49 /DNA_ID= /DNA_START= /DNA_END= /DNA_ORIENTATION=
MRVRPLRLQERKGSLGPKGEGEGAARISNARDFAPSVLLASSKNDCAVV